MTVPAPGRPVVVGVDGSENARAAAHLAAEEARRRGAPLELVSALPRAFFGTVTVTPEPGLFSAINERVSEVLRSVAAEVADAAGEAPVSWSVVEGAPADVLREASGRAQLVVLGSRGVGGVAGLVTGSTASAVVPTADCPVLVLPDDVSTTVSERRSVVVGVEGRPGDDEVLSFAFEEAAARGTDLVAVHAWQDVVLETPYQSLSVLVDWSSVREDEGRVLAETMAGWRDKVPDVPVREVVVRDRTARALVAAALTAELLVIGHRRRNRLARLGSTTHGVLHRTTCPLAVVPIPPVTAG
ncbi:universal stress protein [Modestobacter sp. I12A-02662]|uniref:universal stress protein n=1 Tax=Modestobacter sp. I12A-02662 TaxID=1730496 RepID=UPI0034DF97C5